MSSDCLEHVELLRETINGKVYTILLTCISRTIPSIEPKPQLEIIIPIDIIASLRHLKQAIKLMLFFSEKSKRLSRIKSPTLRLASILLAHSQLSDISRMVEKLIQYGRESIYIAIWSGGIEPRTSVEASAKCCFNPSSYIRVLEEIGILDPSRSKLLQLYAEKYALTRSAVFAPLGKI